MRINAIRLQAFRNISFEALTLRNDRCFLVGNNGQGKSNMLEAIGFLTALRSFRTQNLAALQKQGDDGFALLYEIEHENDGEISVEIRSAGRKRSAKINGEPVRRLTDLVGRFPTVTMSSADVNLIRGGPAERRRLIDLTLSIVDPTYLRSLRDYGRALQGRNQLLKRGGSDVELDAFEDEMATHAFEIQKVRTLGCDEIATYLQTAYQNIATEEEKPSIVFSPNLDAQTFEEFRETFVKQRKRDQIVGSTQKGPHRDDFLFSIYTGDAKEYASDGQQRALMLALRLAQLEMFRQKLGVAPVLLADDILGELDGARKKKFWTACPEDLQIVATGTSFVNDGQNWDLFSVESGKFVRAVC